MLALLLCLSPGPSSAARQLLNALAERPRHHYSDSLGVAYFKARQEPCTAPLWGARFGSPGLPALAFAFQPTSCATRALTSICTPSAAVRDGSRYRGRGKAERHPAPARGAARLGAKGAPPPRTARSAPQTKQRTRSPKNYVECHREPDSARHRGGAVLVGGGQAGPHALPHQSALALHGMLWVVRTEECQAVYHVWPRCPPRSLAAARVLPLEQELKSY